MSSKSCRTLVAVAVAAAIAAPAAQAMPLDGGPHVRPAHVASQQPSGLGMEYGDLRVPPAQEQTSALASPVESHPVVASPGGFDWTAAAIGAIVAAGLGLLALVFVAVRRPAGRRAASA